MLESVLAYMGQAGLFYVYLIIILFALIENIFPPSPSDIIVVVGVSILVKMNEHLLPALILTSLASSIGFMIMYWVGNKLGMNLVKTHRIKFIHESDLIKVDTWFKKYGYKLILLNRFLPGTRSVISFFSGVHELTPLKTFVNATISALLWNIFIFWLGIILGANIEVIDYYLKTYTTIGAILTVIVLLFFIAKHYFLKRKSEK